MKKFLTILSFIFFFALTGKAQETKSLPKQYQEAVTDILGKIPDVAANQATQIMDFAKSLLGVRYKYASSSPERGFDCSGFVSYVFKNFGKDLPRSSGSYKNLGTALEPEDFKVGDILVFYGYQDKSIIGHLGIICEANGMKSKFIHASSGKVNSVTITALDTEHYTNRFYKCIDVLSK